MTTAGARLVFLSGGAPRSAGERLAGLAAGVTAGQILVARSGLGSATAAVHLMYDPAPPADPGADRFVGFIVNLGRMMGR